MSDILIKGMEMPKEGNVYLIIGEDGVVSEKIGSMYHVTTEAIELPPHGDLGDLSELSMTLYLELETQTPKTLGEVMQIIKKVFDDAPTVLEAST